MPTLQKILSLGSMALILAACSGAPPPAVFYVITDAHNAPRFTDDLSERLKAEGLRTNLGQATDDHGVTLRVLEAKGHGLRVWAQNEPAGGRDMTDGCRGLLEAGPDPGQYIVSIEPRFSLGSRYDPQALARKLERDLQRDGYRPSSKATNCSPLGNG